MAVRAQYVTQLAERFLNQALSFLINEHQYIDELSASYHKDTLFEAKEDKLIYYESSIWKIIYLELTLMKKV